MQRVLITGSNRGIGLEFARQLLERGDHVFAACRTPDAATKLHALAATHGDRLSVLPLDVTDQATIDASHAAVGQRVDGLDLLINNAGIHPRPEHIGNLDAETLTTAFRVNAVAPIMVAQRYLDLLRAGSDPKIVNITTQMASLAQKHGGGSYGYSASKTALNMLTRLLAFEVARMGIVAVMIHPGWVKTDMGGSGAPLTPKKSVRGMLEVIDGLTTRDAGRYLQWDGSELPW
jgi:NAD(P)-dependent dehydrogenase (short-subunit alcohol dehydrogenase family)